MDTTETFNYGNDVMNNEDKINVTLNTSANSSIDENQLLIATLGSRYRSQSETVILTVFYSAIFVTGVVGNVSTCIVIIKNGYMHTATNYYLFSLAVSDLMTLILGLPPELYSIWEAYPWRFGEPYCQFKSFITEMTSTASVLTITSFTVERYVAICHPIRSQTMSNLSRAIKIIILIWIMAAVMVLPVPLHMRTFHLVTVPYKIADSLVCSVPKQWLKYKMNYYFAFSTCVLFLLPMSIISALYILIGLSLRRSGFVRQCSSIAGRSPQYQSRRTVLKMLVAVVVAFFICWAPFHAQRLMTVFIESPSDWTELLLEIQSQLFYISGVLWFVSSTVNPILYNLMSRKYRAAFKHTLCRCWYGSSELDGRPHPSLRRFTSQPSQTYLTNTGSTRILPEKHRFSKSVEEKPTRRWSSRFGMFGFRKNGNLHDTKLQVANGRLNSESSASPTSSPGVAVLAGHIRDEMELERLCPDADVSQT